MRRLYCRECCGYCQNNMKVQSDGMELEIVLNTESDVAQMAKLLAKQVAVVSVNTLMLQEQAAV